MSKTVRSAIMGKAIVILGFALCVTLSAQETVFLSDYFPVDQKTYCRKYYQQTIGDNVGEQMVSEVIGEITVPYATGPLTGSLLWGMAGGRGLSAWYSDREILINILEGSEYLAGDCDLVEPGIRYENFYNGQLLELSTLGGCYQIPKDLSACTGSSDCEGTWLIQIQDVIVQGITYPEALLIWMLGDSGWVQPDLQLLSFGIIPPDAGATGDMRVAGLIVLVKNMGPVLNGGFDDSSGELIVLWELVSVSCDKPFYHAFDVPANMFTQAWGGNDKGDVVGIYAENDQSPLKGFLKKKGSITSIEYPETLWTQALDINNAGDIIGKYQDGNGFQHGFLLEKGNFTTIDFPGAGRTHAWGINEPGSIVGIYLDALGWHGFLLEKGNFTTIDFPEATGTFARGISNEGHIVGNYRGQDNFNHGFLLKENEFTTIDFPEARQTWPYGVNENGHVVGTYQDQDFQVHSFILEKNEFTTSDNPCGLSERFTDINDRGHIIGYFVDPDGHYGFTLVY